MTTLCINGKFLAQPITGTQRYARELLREIDTLLLEDRYKELDIEVLAPQSVLSIPDYKNIRVRHVGRTSGTLWEQLELPFYCGNNVLFTPSGGAPLMHSRNTITIHDGAVFAAPDGYSSAYRLWYQMLYQKMAQRAIHIFTVSHFSKSEIVKWCFARQDAITVTYPGSNHFTKLQADSSTLDRFGIQGKYVLAVSSHNPNKNFARTVRALSSLSESGVEVVIVGGSDSRVYGRGVDPPKGARLLGYVSDTELKALYEGAECFVFASLYEGFGLPPLEAMSCGCPVVVSRVASLPEIFKAAATFCDPFDEQDIAASVLRSIMSPPAPPQKLKEAAGMYTWEKCARETLDRLTIL